MGLKIGAFGFENRGVGQPALGVVVFLSINILVELGRLDYLGQELC